MATQTVTQLKAELAQFRAAVSDLIAEYKDDLCEDGLREAAERLQPFGVVFPSKEYSCQLVDVYLKGATSGVSLNSYGGTTSQFDAALIQAMRAKLGSTRLEFEVGTDKVTVEFEDASIDNLDEQY